MLQSAVYVYGGGLELLETGRQLQFIVHCQPMLFVFAPVFLCFMFGLTRFLSLINCCHVGFPRPSHNLVSTSLSYRMSSNSSSDTVLSLALETTDEMVFSLTYAKTYISSFFCI